MVSNFRSDGSGLNFTVVFFFLGTRNHLLSSSTRIKVYPNCLGLIAPAPPSYPLLGKKRIFWITFEPFNSFSFYNFVISKPSNLLIF